MNIHYIGAGLGLFSILFSVVYGSRVSRGSSGIGGGAALCVLGSLYLGISLIAVSGVLFLDRELELFGGSPGVWKGFWTGLATGFVSGLGSLVYWMTKSSSNPHMDEGTGAAFLGCMSMLLMIPLSGVIGIVLMMFEI